MVKQECQTCGIVVTGFPLTCPYCGRDAGFRLLDAMAKDDKVICLRLVLGLNTAKAIANSLDFAANQSPEKHQASLKFMAKAIERTIEQVYKDCQTSFLLEIELTNKRMRAIAEAMAVNARYVHSNGYITLLSQLNENFVTHN